MYQVHVVGSSASLQHTPISTPALFAQLVYRTSRLSSSCSGGGCGDNGGVTVNISASTTAPPATTTTELTNTGLASPYVDPALLTLATHVSGGSSSSSLEAHFGPPGGGACVATYPFFNSSFFEIEERFHHSSTTNGNDFLYDVIVCADVDAFDSVTRWFSSRSVASSSPLTLEMGDENEEQGDDASRRCGPRRRGCCVVAHIPAVANTELQSRLPMLYSTLVSSLVAAAAAASPTPSSWAHGIDVVFQKFLAVRSTEVMYAVIG